MGAPRLRRVGLLLLTSTVILVGLWVGRSSTDGVWQHLLETVLGEVIANTVRLLLGVGVGVTVLGVTLAWLTAACDFPGRRYLEWGLMLPLSIPPYVTAFVAIGLLDFSGPIQTGLRTLLNTHDLPFPSIRSSFGVIGVMTCALYPYVYLFARHAFLTQGPSALEAAQSLGRSRVQGFFRVAVPMARPWIINGVALALMETLADFGCVAVFNYDTFTTAIYKAWFALFSLPTAARLAASLGIITCTLWWVISQISSKPQYAPFGKPIRVPLSGVRGMLAALYAGLVFSLAFLIPLGQLLFWAIRSLSQELDARYLNFLGHSLFLGGVAACLTCACALWMGIAGRRTPSSFVQAMIRFATMGYAIPGSVLAVGLFIFFAFVDDPMRTFLQNLLPSHWRIAPGALLNGTLWALLLAYLIRFLSVAYGAVDSAIHRVTPNLDEAARSLGVGYAGLLRKIYFPIMRGGLLTAAALVCVDVMKEMPITLMMRPFGWETLSVRIFELTSEGAWERAAIPSIALVLACSLPVMALIKWEMQQDLRHDDH